MRNEYVVDARTGHIREAGTLGEDGGRHIDQLRTACEQSLYLYTKFVLGRDYLTDALHEPVCMWLQTPTPQRKMLLLPREHAKTSMVSHGLPTHILIQPAESNIYVPGMDGADCRILLSCETEARATDHIRVMETAFESNDLLRALWPHRCWTSPRKQSKKWNDREFIIPRAHEYPDPSVRGIGVGGAITGAHPNILIKDDLISIEAANSPIVMHTAIRWHVTSRALINTPDSLEFIIGTRWAVGDLYQYIIDNDESVGYIVRAIVENGETIYPERFTLEKVAQLRKEFGTLFPLLYMNSAADPDLVDFDLEDIREFYILDDQVVFTEDERDTALRARLNVSLPREALPTRGVPLNEDTYDRMFGQFRYQRIGRVRST